MGVAYASISNNGKGHAIVQFETDEEAKNAISIMRDYPLNDKVLYVRHDVQKHSRNSNSQQQASWKCAHETESIPDHSTVLSLIDSRNQARKIRDYSTADDIRKELLEKYSVHVDDTLKLYWNDSSKLASIKGSGHWSSSSDSKKKKLLPWRQIPTSPLKDELVHSNLIYALLRQRDEARQAKLYDKADELLDRIINAPQDDNKDSGIIIKINDEYRTWKVWSLDPPQKPTKKDADNNSNNSNEEIKIACLKLVNKYQPDKIQDAYDLLNKFEGREEYILEKLKAKFLS